VQVSAVKGVQHHRKDEAHLRLHRDCQHKEQEGGEFALQ
jgi:hypothetical protein